ncbi:ATP-binding cassette domain-containing protein [Amycolatopsis rubida]|uniref:ABC-2 type transport system ATP-binding protein n=1 Tax=Amycolatopsis rubida TaxID=112413 RepID=A0A1I5I571_9PSEU|nr:MULTISPECIES: ATP-binding cassette domain-containing protein [Amycolatopsis]MYW96559.1 ATP-binding cassette domain-containing protein [Amycolatopsis rubida]NEC61544.1 ATP-binding cassette domain-containing protein [Amycolatopsis rubida]OAP25822.1 Daunorubicin/doxorubicin resistance ATP-binding protein DrrA [Amycolatopsis sp. M39]SFO55677.1 ABC-2 type transport system ATP-binding protein [Amycolatopsis rubida]
MVTGYAIEARGLRKSYGDVKVLESVDLSVRRGTMFALLGPNGAGKTTTVRILSTLLDADGGTVTVNGHDLAGSKRTVREQIGLTGQDTAVDELLTGRENLEMMARLFHLPAARAKARATELLAQFDLVAAAGRQVKTYSGGMRRRLDLAISLITSPPVLFLDEPTTGLDPRSRSAMWDAIRELLTGGTTILLTTQYLEEADQLADRIAVIDKGRVVAEGTAAELKRKVGTERLKLTFATAADAARAHDVAGGVLTGDTVSVAIDQPAQVRLVLNRIDEAGLATTRLELSEPTLDDVFHTLTGTAGAN